MTLVNYVPRNIKVNFTSFSIWWIAREELWDSPVRAAVLWNVCQKSDPFIQELASDPYPATRADVLHTDGLSY